MPDADLKQKCERDQTAKADKPKVQVTLEWQDYTALKKIADSKGMKLGTLARMFILEQVLKLNKGGGVMCNTVADVFNRLSEINLMIAIATGKVAKDNPGFAWLISNLLYQQARVLRLLELPAYSQQDTELSLDAAALLNQIHEQLAVLEGESLLQL
ncbi:hypothetical protein ACUHGC_07485 [Testudinibacter sp. P27/CKL/0425]